MLIVCVFAYVGCCRLLHFGFARHNRDGRGIEPGSYLDAANRVHRLVARQGRALRHHLVRSAGAGCDLHKAEHSVTGGCPLVLKANLGRRKNRTKEKDSSTQI